MRLIESTRTYFLYFTFQTILDLIILSDNSYNYLFTLRDEFQAVLVFTHTVSCG